MSNERQYESLTDWEACAEDSRIELDIPRCPACHEKPACFKDRSGQYGIECSEECEDLAEAYGYTRAQAVARWFESIQQWENENESEGEE